jgi:hypothetical protein
VKRRFALAGAVVLTVMTLTTGVTAASATIPTQNAADVRLTLIEQNLWILPEGRLEATIHLDQLAPAGSEIAVVIYQRLRSRSLFQASLEGDLGSPLATVSRPIGELTRDARGDIVVSAPISASSQPGRTRIRVDGVYPLRIELRTPDGDLIDGITTHLVRSSPDAVGSQPLAVALLVPLAAAPALAPDGSTRLLDEDRAALSLFVAALGRHPDVPLTTLPSAETLAALDATASTEDRQLHEQLRTAIGTRQVVAGPYVDIDAAAMLHDGLADEVTTQLRSGSDALAATLAPARPDGRTWIADQPLDGLAVAGLRDLGVDQLVLREDLLAPTALPFTLTRPASLEVEGVTVQSTTFIDDGLVAHFVDRGDPALSAVHLLTDLSQLYFDSPSIERGTVVRPPADWDPSPVFLDVLLDGLATSPLLDAVTVDEYFRTVPRAVDEDGLPVVRSLAAEPAPSATPGATPGFGASLLRTRQRLTGFATMVEEDDALLDSARRRLLVASAVGLEADRRDAYLDAVDAEINQQTSFLRAPARQSVTLTSRDASVPLTIRSTSPSPLRVRVVLTSPKLDFPDGAAQVVTVDGANNTVTFKVRARASGTFPLTVQVTSPDGTLPIATERLTVRSTAVSGMGFVLSAGAGLFLAGWWVHHLRSSRRLQRRQTRASHPTSASPSP